jgi:hypothetical protein
MRKGQTKGEKGLTYPVMTRITKAKYDELKTIAAKTKDETVSGLLRNIIHNRPVTVHTHDETFNLVMEELAALRGEIKSIGININQVTRLFNTYPEERRKEFYAKIAFNQYLGIETKIDRLLTIVSKLAKKWLSE